MQKAQAEQAKLNETLTLRRQQYKEKNQHYSDLKALCEREATIKDLENYRSQLEAGKPCPLCGSSEHPAIEKYQSIELTDNQRRRDALEKEVASLKDEGLLVLGQVNALTQQIQRETDETQTLSQEEQTLTKEWLDVCTSLNISLNIQEDIATWMNAQEHYERQLYQLSQRLTLQNQLREQEEQEHQYQQQLTSTRQTLENTLLTLSLSVPDEGTEATWLNIRETEFAQWQEKQTQHAVVQKFDGLPSQPRRFAACRRDGKTVSRLYLFPLR